TSAAMTFAGYNITFPLASTSKTTSNPTVPATVVWARPTVREPTFSALAEPIGVPESANTFRESICVGMVAWPRMGSEQACNAAAPMAAKANNAGSLKIGAPDGGKYELEAYRQTRATSSDSGPSALDFA